MGIDTRRPPLPAPTEDPSSMESESVIGTDLGTNVSRRTDKTSFSIPEDGSPITISTHKLNPKEGFLQHGRQRSQTSLLIEYFEAGKNGDKTRARPSVRVKVTPSAARKSRTASGASDAIQITGIGKDRKPSYTRRISLGNKNTEALLPVEATEVSHSSESNLSGRPPIEVEVMNNGSDLSTSRTSRDLPYMYNNSDISSMPPDSMLEGATATDDATIGAPTTRERSRSLEREDVVTTDHLKAPTRRRSRSLSRERMTQKVMEKLGSKPRTSSRRHSREHGIEYEPETKPSKERRRRSSRTHRDDDTVSGAESSLLSSNITPSQASYRSGTSKVSLNNPRLLEMVEDTVKRLILPEITQLKQGQRNERNLDEFDRGSRRTSAADRDSYGSEELTRRVSKSSSSPNISSKPKVVLNRYDDDPGEVLSRGDSERRKVRRSSRDSLERSHKHRPSSRHDSIEEETVHKKKSKDGHRLRDAAAAGIAGGVLTAAALKHHDSQGSVNREKRKKRSKSRSSRSRSASIAETAEEYHEKEDIPPMPFASHINDSEITRESIVSEATERPHSRSSRGMETPVRQVSRGSVAQAMSPSARTPTRTPQAFNRSLGSDHTMRSAQEIIESSPQSNRSISNKAKIAALAAAGLGGTALGKKLADDRAAYNVDDFGSPRSAREASPVESVSSIRDHQRDPLIPQGLRPRSQLSLTPGNYEISKSPAVDENAIPRSLKSPLGRGNDTFTARSLERNVRPESDPLYDDGTPKEDMEEWFQKQHEENERYRKSLAAQSPMDHNRLSQYTEDSYANSQSDRVGDEQDIRALGDNPEYVHTPVAVESAVASLLDPSMVDSSVRSSEGTGSRVDDAKYRERMADNVRELSRASPAPHDIKGAPGVEQSPLSERWSALRNRAQSLSAQASKERAMAATGSPRGSETRSLREEKSYRGGTPVQMSASGLPIADDPMPEIGHGLDAESDIITNPSDIKGHVEGSPATRDERWSYDSTSSPGLGKQLEEQDRLSQRSGHGGKAALLGAGAAAGALAAHHVLSGKQRSPSEHGLSRGSSFADEYHDRGLTPDIREAQAVSLTKSHSITPTSPARYGDEGYETAYPRSPGAATPKAAYSPQPRRSDEDMAEYEAALGADADDPFISTKHARHMSANSHGMASPLYDSATGKGIDRIKSQDVVALMDHLTVRDAQRNARDTEILVSLVRSAAEMRQSFEEMKRFISEQDKMIMKNTDRDADITVQKVLGGPRPQPASAPRTPRASYDEQELSTKRKNVFKRALKGLSMRSSGDLSRIEDMLNQLLGDVEELKDGHGSTRKHSMAHSYNDSLDSYEKLRAAPDSGYEPEGQAGTSSTPNQSGNFSLTPTREERNYHSGYDGRRGSYNRVSTVMEGDEDELEPHEERVLQHEFENNERFTPPQTLTPTQETRPNNGAYRDQSPDVTPKTADKQRKHKSTSSSIFGIPKMSRWSKTTASSAPQDDNLPDTDPYQNNEKRYSAASRSADSLSSAGAAGGPGYYGNNYTLHSDDRLRSTQSLAREKEAGAPRSIRSARSTITRTPSPLIPENASAVSQSRPRSLGPDVGATPSPKPGMYQRSPERREFEDGDGFSVGDGDSVGNGDEDDVEVFDDPKYQAHRNSLLLEHPQPRQGPTHRHQTYLESQAQSYKNVGSPGLGKEVGMGLGLGMGSATGSDVSQRTTTTATTDGGDESDFDPLQWGNTPSLSLARTNRLGMGAGGRDDGPLVPGPSQTKQALEPSSLYGRGQQGHGPGQAQGHGQGYGGKGNYAGNNAGVGSCNGAGAGGVGRMYYSSPLGSGHLLEPIEEVRYSLETDRHVSFAPSYIQHPTSILLTTCPTALPLTLREPEPEHERLESAAHAEEDHGAETYAGEGWGDAGWRRWYC